MSVKLRERDFVRFPSSDARGEAWLAIVRALSDEQLARLAAACRLELIYRAGSEWEKRLLSGLHTKDSA